MQIREGNASWRGGMAKNITFIVTKDCQLACKYCYLVGKNMKERMSFETAKAADPNPVMLCMTIGAAVHRFVGEAPQTDDITIRAYRMDDEKGIDVRVFTGDESTNKITEDKFFAAPILTAAAAKALQSA